MEIPIFFLHNYMNLSYSVLLEGGSPLEIRELEYFIAIVETGSFSRAAERYYVSQPCLTHAIQRLEKELGVQLLDRSHYRPILTEEGQFFLISAKKIIAEVAFSYNEMNEYRNLARGTIEFAIPPMMGTYLLPQLIANFQTKYPQLTLNIHEEGSREVRHLLEQEQADIGIISLAPDNQESLETFLLTKQQIHLTVGHNHRLAKQKNVFFRELTDEKFILLKDNFTHRHLVVQRCKEAGFSPNIIITSSQGETVKALVAHNVGISFFMEMALEHSHQVASIPLNPPLTMEIGLAWKRNRQHSKATQAFINLATSGSCNFLFSI